MLERIPQSWCVLMAWKVKERKKENERERGSVWNCDKSLSTQTSIKGLKVLKLWFKRFLIGRLQLLNFYLSLSLSISPFVFFTSTFSLYFFALSFLLPSLLFFLCLCLILIVCLSPTLCPHVVIRVLNRSLKWMDVASIVVLFKAASAVASNDDSFQVLKTHFPKSPYPRSIAVKKRGFKTWRATAKLFACIAQIRSRRNR